MTTEMNHWKSKTGIRKPTLEFYFPFFARDWIWNQWSNDGNIAWLLVLRESQLCSMKWFRNFVQRVLVQNIRRVCWDVLWPRNDSAKRVAGTTYFKMIFLTYQYTFQTSQYCDDLFKTRTPISDECVIIIITSLTRYPQLKVLQGMALAAGR